MSKYLRENLEGQRRKVINFYSCFQRIPWIIVRKVQQSVTAFLIIANKVRRETTQT